MQNIIETAKRQKFQRYAKMPKLGIGVFKSQIPNPKNTNHQFKITNWSLYNQVVISTFSSLIPVTLYFSTAARLKKKT